MFRKLFFFICLNSIFLIKGNAQSSSQQLPKIVPPSPNVAALQKFGDIPVSPYTGIPNISIPLYQVSAGNVTVPISISYHASGIKVSDEASRVGLGWALDAGGVISRNVIGADDFDPGVGGYHFTETKPNIVSGAKDFGLSTFILQNGCTIAVPGIPTLKPDLNEGYSYQPDVYNYNFLNYSGKFFLKRDKEVVLSKKEKIKITCLNSSATAWEVITDDGNKFLFEEFETYTENDYDPNIKASKSAWYITKIITQEGDIISFSYIADLNYIKTTGSLFQSYNPNIYPTGSNSNGTPGITNPFISPSHGKKYKNLRLDKIQFKSGEVTFSYSNDRVDLSHDVKLTGIQIYAKGVNNALSLIKQWGFTYGYFEGRNPNGFSLPVETTTKRLRLETLTELDPLGNGLPPYKFKYQTFNDLNPDFLPQKTSYSRDHWGYFNNKNNNTLIPSFLPGGAPTNPVISAIGIQGNERDADRLYSQLFSLTEIIYPTGGKTVFEYESHDFDLSKSMINDRSEQGSFPEAVQKEVTEEYTNPTGVVPLPGDLQNKLMDLTDLFLIPNETVAKVELTGFFRFKSNTLPGNCQIPPNKIKLALVREDGAIMGETNLSEHLGLPGSTDRPLAICENSSGQPIGITFLQDYYNISPGKYYWRLNIEAGYDAVLDAKVKLSYKGVKSMQPIDYNGSLLSNVGFGGGIRIKRISDYHNEIDPPKVKRYDYHSLVDGKRISNGRRMSRPTYSYFEDVWGQTEIGSTTNIYSFERLFRESDSNIPLNGSAGGGNVGYDKVTIFLGEAGEYGKTEYEFENVPDVIWDYGEAGSIFNIPAKIPRKPPVFGGFSNPTNGNVKVQTDFENHNGYFFEVQKVENTYEDLLLISNPLWYGIEKRAFNAEINGGSSFFTCPYRIFLYPTIVEGRKLLTSTTTRTFDKIDLTKTISKTVNYNYNNTTHLQLLNTIELNSKGDEITRTSSYPLDYSVANADLAINQMMSDKFMHGKVIMQTTSVKKAGSSVSLVTAATINKYQASTSNPLTSTISLKEITALETTTGVAAPLYVPSSGNYPTGFQPKILFEKYDAFGNILQMRKNSDVIYSYIWGYNNSYPVAEIVGASHTDANALLNQTTLAIAIDNDIIIRSELDKIRIGLPKAMVNTYTYKPLIGSTSQTDPGGKITFYEYDNFNRLKTIRNKDQYVVKHFEYTYALPIAGSSCGTNCTVLTMLTLNGTKTIGYPVGVFNVNGKLLGNAFDQNEFKNKWNNDVANQAVGSLDIDSDPMYFKLTYNNGASIPSGVTGCRYYQFDLPYTTIDGIRRLNAVYIDFGDGTSMPLGKSETDNTGVILPPNTIEHNVGSPYYYFTHNYPDNSLKTLTFYHNEVESPSIDNVFVPATSLMLLKNFKGTYPQNAGIIGSSCFQQSSAQTVASIVNWNSISNIKVVSFHNGDSQNPCLNLDYAQDFMANNRGLEAIRTAHYGPDRTGYRDLSFKISRLKSDWNTYFTQLNDLRIKDEHWNREDLSALKNLKLIFWFASRQNYQDGPGNPFIPIPSLALDNFLGQISRGAGQTVTNGIIRIESGGTTRSNVSDGAVNQLKAKGWTITISGVNQ
jgi:hypothetical protein